MLYWFIEVKMSAGARVETPCIFCNYIYCLAWHVVILLVSSWLGWAGDWFSRSRCFRSGVLFSSRNGQLGKFGCSARSVYCGLLLFSGIVFFVFSICHCICALSILRVLLFIPCLLWRGFLLYTYLRGSTMCFVFAVAAF